MNQKTFYIAICLLSSSLLVGCAEAAQADSTTFLKSSLEPICELAQDFNQIQIWNDQELERIESIAEQDLRDTEYKVTVSESVEKGEEAVEESMSYTVEATPLANNSQPSYTSYLEPYYEESYYSEDYSDYSDSYQTPSSYDGDFMSAGEVYDENGTRYTWYSQNVLPGDGLTELNENGRHVNDEGYVVDGDGYIAVASSDYEQGTILDTPFGEAKVYDTGCPSGTVDVYTDF